MYRPRQFTLPIFPKSKTSFGGSFGLKKRKTARPLCENKAVHIVLRSERAKGNWNLLEHKNARLVWKLAKEYGKRFEVRIYDFANVGNHLHLLVKGRTRHGLRNFLRVYAGQVAQKITNAKSGSPLNKRFWEFIVFTRIVEWGRAFTIAKKYLYKNILEACHGLKGYPLRN